MTIVELKTIPSYSNFLTQDQICEINTTETRWTNVRETNGMTKNRLKKYLQTVERFVHRSI